MAAMALASCASAHTAKAPLGPVAIKVPSAPSVTAEVRIAFRARGELPRGGYYYAVAVLAGYASYSQAAPPPCAVSSDMQKTVYGSGGAGRVVRLVLIAAPSAAKRWCAGATYEGAIYAVPHKPPCASYYGCSGRSAESGPCWTIEGRRVCGVVVAPKYEPPSKEGGTPAPGGTYSYPGGLPKPAEKSARLVGRFTLRFG